MRMQAYGPKMSLRRLLYIPPTWVRPDLPAKPGATGYRIEGETK
jgi:hypothetical protein